MHYILGTLALLGVGFIGLLIEIHKQDKAEIARVSERNENQYNIIMALNEDRDRLADQLNVEHQLRRSAESNQKPVPWNKGKKGQYKLPRVQKVQVAPNGHDMTMVLNTKVNNGIISAWDKDGNQTVTPVWEPLG